MRCDPYGKLRRETRKSCQYQECLLNVSTCYLFCSSFVRKRGK